MSNQLQLSQMPPPEQNRLLVSELPDSQKPVYRVMNDITQCNNTELLAALIGGNNQVQIAEALLKEFDGEIRNIYRATAEEMSVVKGVSTAIAARIKAGMYLGIRLIGPQGEKIEVNSPGDAAQIVINDMALLEREHLRVILLDRRNRVIKVASVYEGSVSSSQVRVGEVFEPALRNGASAIIVVHNHPSGDPTPSPDDVAVTRAIVQAGKILDIDVLDHVVIGHGKWVSLKERGLGFSG